MTSLQEGDLINMKSNSVCVGSLQKKVFTVCDISPRYEKSDISLSYDMWVVARKKVRSTIFLTFQLCLWNHKYIQRRGTRNQSKWLEHVGDWASNRIFRFDILDFVKLALPSMLLSECKFSTPVLKLTSKPSKGQTKIWYLRRVWNYVSS